MAAGGAAGGFPVGTLLVNVVGCLADRRRWRSSPRSGSTAGAEARACLMVGLLGGFTTFSAFANETVTAWRSGAAVVAAANVVLSVVPCLAGVAVGRGRDGGAREIGA